MILRKIFILGFLFSLQVVWGQEEATKIKKWKVNPVICELPMTDHVHPHFTPFNQDRKIIGNRETEFEIRYSGAVPLDARNAMGEVTRLASMLFPSDQKIIVSVTFAELPEGSLAGATSEAFYSDFPNAPKLSAPYPTPLAEKIARTQINDPNAPDIFISVNQNADWYYDFGNPGGVGSKFDFVGVLFHELLHGLGFSARTAVNGDLGFIRVFVGNNHTAYSDFLENGFGVKLSDITDGSVEMGEQLTGNNLFFRLESGMATHKIYAPVEFNGGSSISHLDESTFNATPSSMMTPFVSRGEVERDPGVATEILYDLGWNFTYLIHSPINDGIEKPIDESYQILVDVESDSEIMEGSLLLHYSKDNFDEDVNEAVLTLVEGITYTAEIPAPNEEATYRYYFTAEDSRGMNFRQPGVNINGPQQFFEYTFGPDRIPPLIFHEPITEVTEKDKIIDIEATVIDAFTGVDSVFIEWRINGEMQPSVGLRDASGESFEENIYKGALVFPRALNVSDQIEYRVRALDNGSFPNLGRTPRGENYFTVEVVPVLEPTITYVNDFDIPSEDFGGDFTIITPGGFSNPALHSPHPYANAGTNNSLDYISELKVPIIVDNEFPFIEFDEIVIVEPGEPNVPFGQDEFWDYVIVEAKSQREGVWRRLLNGYDSRAQGVWLARYNAGGNGDQTLFRTRVIDITNNGDFVASDTIAIRFRLFSDPFVVGWGWAIDNLKIQELAVSTIDKELDDNLVIFPNPVFVDRINIEIPPSEKGAILLELFDLAGKRMMWQTVQRGSNIIPIDHPPGTYIFRFTTQEGTVSRKIIKLGQ